MDPAQRLTWLREHQLPNQKPSKLKLTDTQNLTRHQIYKLQFFKRPKLLHTQSSEDQTDLQRIVTDLQSPIPMLTTTPTQIPQPNLLFLEKRNDQDEQKDPNKTKKHKLENAPDATTSTSNTTYR